jgi:hypothetical protein
MKLGLGMDPNPTELTGCFRPSDANLGGGGTSGLVVRQPCKVQQYTQKMRIENFLNQFTARLLPNRMSRVYAGYSHRRLKNNKAKKR